MRKILIILVVFIGSTYSCIMKGDPSTVSNFNIVNQTEHKLTLVTFSNADVLYDSLIIISKNTYLIKKVNQSGVDFQLGDMKRGLVYFDDTILYINYRDSLSDLPSGNILKLGDWSGGKVEDYLYEYEFKFTEEDYKEALKLQ